MSLLISVAIAFQAILDLIVIVIIFVAYKAYKKVKAPFDMAKGFLSPSSESTEE